MVESVGNDASQVGRQADDRKTPTTSPSHQVESNSPYFSLSSQSSLASPQVNTGTTMPQNDTVKTVIDDGKHVMGNTTNENLSTIESSAKLSASRQREDSDDLSFSKIKPVHNFFGQHQFSPYDSDGSDGSLVFSPGSVTDDHKTGLMTTDRKEVPVSTAPAATTLDNMSSSVPFSRNRFSSTDSMASNGSIRYVRSNTLDASEVKENNSSSEPINPQLLPYNERRKLMQQKQYEGQHQQFQYHAPIAPQVHAQPQHQQGHQPHPSGTYPYPIDSRMVAGYYHMYGMPPPGMFSPTPPQDSRQQSGLNMQGPGHLLPGPHGVPPYYHHMHSAGTAQQMSSQLYPSVQQFQYHVSSTGYQQPYSHTSIQNHPSPPQFPPPYGQPSNVPSSTQPYPLFAYIPPKSNNSTREQSQQQQQQQRDHQEPVRPPQIPRSGSQSSLDRSRNRIGKETESNIQTTGIPRGSHLIQSPTSSTNNSTRTNGNPPRFLPPAGNRRNASSSTGHHRRDIGSTSSIPPPPPPLPTTHYSSASHAGSLSCHSRTDSYGSLSSLGSHGLGSTSFSKEDDDDQQQHTSQLGKTMIENKKEAKKKIDTNPSTPKYSQPTIDTTISSVAMDSPRDSLHARKNSFLDMLRMNWSPQSRSSPSSTLRKQPDVNEFHRKNQEFLNRASTGLPPVAAVPSGKQNHRRLGSQDRPPASRGTHRQLPSISNDEWDEECDDKSSELEEPEKNHTIESSFKNIRSQQVKMKSPGAKQALMPPEDSDELSDFGALTDEDRTTTDEDNYDPIEYDACDNVNELSALLPPSGISSNEHEGKNSKYDRRNRRGRQTYESTSTSGRKESIQLPSSTTHTGDCSESVPRISDLSTSTLRWDNRSRKSRKKKFRTKNFKYTSNSDSCSEDSQDSSDSSFDHRKWTKKRARMLEKERAKLIEQWKREAREEAERVRKEEELNRWHRRLWRVISERLSHFGILAFRCLTMVEKFIGNLPLTIGAVALAIVTLGVVWFKFAEEYLDTCEPVHFHSSQCTFPEFPGCFYCDTSATGYKIAVGFHYTCTIISGMLSMLLVAKIILATRVVVDEMSSPTTSSPAGLLCMTTVCVFAGRGMVGQIIVSTAACFHLALAIWFIYMALAYNIMPEPSWFPNTIGIGLSAVKTWLYYPMPGHLLMAISLSLNFFFFPISLIRVAVNKKISATVGWMQMSAPAVSLYALTIMAQPSFEEEQPDVTNFQRVHRMVYLPCMHVMCALSLIGMGASLHSLYDRWRDFKRKEFSPAHAAFCFPTLSHANSLQAYRGAVRSFSQVPPRSWRMFLLDGYWFIVLVGGTIATVWICGKFLYKLPEWTSPDLSNEEEPPAPYETLLSQQRMVTAGDTLTQNFVSPAILQANETGALILSRSARDGTLRYVRTRRIRALGFEPTMNWSEIQEEEEKLLEWVGKHPPRRRHRTLSVPGIDFNYGSSQPVFGTGNSGVYSSYSPIPTSGPGRRRSLSQGQHSTFFK